MEICFVDYHQYSFVVDLLLRRLHLHLQAFEFVNGVDDGVAEEVDAILVMFDVMSDRVFL